MNFDKLQKAYQRGEDCPSEATLDQLHLQQLGPLESRVVKQHLSDCLVCQARWEKREQGFDAFPQLDVSALDKRIQQAVGPESFSEQTLKTLARLRTEAQGPARPQRAGWWFGLGWKWFLAGATACAALLILVFLGDSQLVPKTSVNNGIRVKGQLQLVVYRADDIGDVDIVSSRRFHPGDKLRFGTTLPHSGHVMVVGQEHSGKLYSCFPADGKNTSQPAQAGKTPVLPGAVMLDESIGSEWMWLILCHTPFSLPDLHVGPRPGTLLLPAGCRSTAFPLVKVNPI